MRNNKDEFNISKDKIDIANLKIIKKKRIFTNKITTPDRS